MNYLAEIRKALVPIAIGAILTGLATLGIAGEMTVAEAVTYAVTAIAVYLVPNKPRKDK